MTTNDSNKINNNEIISRIIEDAQLVAFMMYKGYKIVPLRNIINKNYVVFEVIGIKEELDDCVAMFYGGVDVNITEYIKCLKSVKSLMYTMKEKK